MMKNWLLAIRPKTLTAAISPVLIGTAMAYGDGIEHLPTAFLCLAAALFIQIGTNLANDYFDFKKGVDTTGRVGPTRVTQAGLIAPTAVRNSFVLFFALAAIIAVALFFRAGWPVAVIAVASIISGVLYTAGPYPLAYVGLGDLFVLIFFGPVAVGGTYYVQSHEINMAVILAGFAPGLISTAILTVNNYRDIISDRATGRKTLAVRFGAGFAQKEYLFCILTAALIPVIIFYLINDHRLILLSSVTALLAIPAIQKVLTTTDGPILNTTLASTGKLLLIYSVLFSLGWAL